MGIRLRDEAILLEPDITADRLTEEEAPDWDKDPLSATPTAFQCQPVSSTEEALTAETIVSRFRGTLRPMWDGILTSDWRIRWDGEDYTIEGEVERHKKGRRVRFLTVTLSKIEG